MIADDTGVREWRSALQKINSHAFSGDFNLLSVAAKVALLSREAMQPLTVRAISERARTYGWNLSDSQVRQVVEFLEYLGLVKVGR